MNDDPQNLQNFVTKNDIIGVIGSSHSSILSLKHLESLENAIELDLNEQISINI